MQTFLPHSDFAESARCLDRQRLGKQRVECLQVARALVLPSYGWQNHPAVQMWRGYERALLRYGFLVCDRWSRLGYQDTVGRKLSCLAHEHRLHYRAFVLPPWIGDPAFHAAHRAALLFKNPKWYSQFGWTETPAVPDAKGRLPYVWPV